MIPNKKNRKEKGVRDLPIESKPHSKAVNLAHSIRHPWEIQNAPKTIITAIKKIKNMYTPPTLTKLKAPISLKPKNTSF